MINQVNGASYGARLDTTNYNVDNGWGVECPDQMLLELLFNRYKHRHICRAKKFSILS